MRPPAVAGTATGPGTSRRIRHRIVDGPIEPVTTLRAPVFEALAGRLPRGLDGQVVFDRAQGGLARDDGSLPQSSDNLLAPKWVGFNIAGRHDDYRFFRYGFTSCLLGDGYFSFTDDKAGYSRWCGSTSTTSASARRPSRRLAAPGRTASRRCAYQDALVLVNPNAAAHTVTVEAGWRTFKGQQASDVNTGLAARDVMLERTTVCCSSRDEFDRDRSARAAPTPCSPSLVAYLGEGDGGAERQTMQLARLLSDRFDVVLGYLKSGPDNQGRIEALGALLAAVVDLDARRRLDWGAVRRLADLEAQWDVDVVLCTNTFPCCCTRSSRVGGTAPALRVVEVYHTTLVTGRAARLKLLGFRPLFRLARHVVFVCEAQRRYCRAHLIGSLRTSVIHNGIDVNYFSPQAVADRAAAERARYGFGPEQLVVGRAPCCDRRRRIATCSPRSRWSRRARFSGRCC